MICWILISASSISTAAFALKEHMKTKKKDKRIWKKKFTNQIQKKKKSKERPEVVEPIEPIEETKITKITKQNQKKELTKETPFSVELHIAAIAIPLFFLFFCIGAKWWTLQ